MSKIELGLNGCEMHQPISKISNDTMHLLWMRLQPSFQVMVQMLIQPVTSFCIGLVVHFSTFLRLILHILHSIMFFFSHMERLVGMLGFLCTIAKLPMRVRAKIKMGNLMVLRMNLVLLQCDGRSLMSPIHGSMPTDSSNGRSRMKMESGGQTQVSFYMVVSEGLVSKITTLLMCYSLGHLFLQYLVDHWAANEQIHLNWIKHNQKAIQADCYQGLVDAVLNNQDPAQVGQCIILPSSHPGTTRNMLQLFQDSMAITHFFGFASYFVTITANPWWPEVQAALEPGQEASERPDIVCQVFYQKLHAFLQDLHKKSLFGNTIACVHVIEFQKCGLPHAHILIWVQNEHQPRDGDDIDKVIRAEIPDPETEPVLHTLVVQCMIHVCDPS